MLAFHWLVAGTQVMTRPRPTTQILPFVFVWFPILVKYCMFVIAVKIRLGVLSAGLTVMYEQINNNKK